jgi:signal peptidase I
MWLARAAVVMLVTASCGANEVGLKRLGFHRQMSVGAALVFVERSEAMQPVLPIGTRVIAEAGVPAIGDVVVMHPPVGAFLGLCGGRLRMLTRGGAACDTPSSRESKIEIASRVVAGPADQIYVHDGYVYRRVSGSSKFRREPDARIRACAHSMRCDLSVPVTIPHGYWFVMGDNRSAAYDSRAWGPVPTSWIVGIVASLECRNVTRRWVRRTVQEGCSGVIGQSRRSSVPHPAPSSSLARPAVRRSISSRVARASAIGRPAGSGRSQSR